ncbi:MAG: tRNA preQ1(34) S-adenosylmethionine ribosyltransferase-isomerase QueA [Candidatus Promineifilaceae bacterium]|nr:tRNA preQ1(34) S-adenosylmethionine ribosyltransferase-isomerase QueA [Candidatus Promineifilaceae bacterium]
MKTEEFDYQLPEKLIAQRPLAQRDSSRLLVLHRESGLVEHRRFTDLGDYLKRGDILVANNSRVFPARLYGRKSTGGRVEFLLLERISAARWKALVGGKRVREGVEIHLEKSDGALSGQIATITAVLDGAVREIEIDTTADETLDGLGHVPLPPYIHEPLIDAERYQTIYSRPVGSAAAPTAGLHFTGDLLFDLRERGVIFETCTLHVGLDTFKPVTADQVHRHTIHSEWAQLTPEAARRINEAKLAGGRLVAVGTTAVRTLETGAVRSAGIVGSLQDISRSDAAGETSNICPWKPVSAFEGKTDLFITPGYKYRAVNAIITNFHLPKSSLIMLVAAFGGQEKLLATYKIAVEEQYRFYSFGDAMLIL